MTVPASRHEIHKLFAELDALRAAGAFDHVDSLRDQYPSPALNGTRR
jgi:hypothetical protein